MLREKLPVAVALAVAVTAADTLWETEMLRETLAVAVTLALTVWEGEMLSETLAVAVTLALMLTLWEGEMLRETLEEPLPLLEGEDDTLADFDADAEGEELKAQTQVTVPVGPNESSIAGLSSVNTSGVQTSSAPDGQGVTLGVGEGEGEDEADGVTLAETLTQTCGRAGGWAGGQGRVRASVR